MFFYSFISAGKDKRIKMNTPVKHTIIVKAGASKS